MNLTARPRIVADLLGLETSNGKNKGNYKCRGPSPFGFAQGQEDGLWSSDVGGGAGSDVDFAGDPGEGEADPEGDSEELVRLEVS
jgi:hypothetical protein